MHQAGWIIVAATYIFTTMKKIYLLKFLLLLCFAVQAQTPWQSPFPIDSATHEISYHGVVQVPSANAAKLFDRAKAWHSANAEVTTRKPLQSNETAGLFIANCTRVIGDKRYLFTFAVEAKTGQYEYLLTQFQWLTVTPTTPSANPRLIPISLPKIIPLLQVAALPDNLTASGQVRPSIRKMLEKADEGFKQIVQEMQHVMNP